MDFIKKSWSRSRIKKRKFMLLAFSFLKEKRICERKQENFSFNAFERNILDQKGKRWRNPKISVHWIQMNFQDT